ncbi:hypothetical protein [Catalinimonas niigatensis]|uniref:hypothetical protein n=1 Tax=Catalinimonas niigatensis TaxID=1397264 RepID=UPI0026661E29|nr:hypothetical protein [Catalinimonas niigatensis]WPP53405.1 hypothetical protein PZB72_13600 [Catalinimonas niigatensis]
MKWTSYAVCTLLACTSFLFVACEDDDPPPAENEEEVITNVTLTFTPEGGGTPVTATWVDADGEGSNQPVLTEIELAANTTYLLDIDLLNAIDPDDIESITEEIREEADEHMLFFGWTDGLFTEPAGDGNIDSRADAVTYEDEDADGLPLGLETSWTTGDAAQGTFQIILKHQPDEKSETSTSQTGETDVDIEWDIIIQ